LRLNSERYTDIETEFNVINSMLNDIVELDITHSNSAIDILPTAHSKLSALDILCSQNGWSSSEFIGFGDSKNDMNFLSVCKVTGAPANCTAQVASTVNHVSKYNDIEGLLEFLNSL